MRNTSCTSDHKYKKDEKEALEIALQLDALFGQLALVKD
jgi:hypothetical protein